MIRLQENREIIKLILLKLARRITRINVQPTCTDYVTNVTRSRLFQVHQREA